MLRRHRATACETTVVVVQEAVQDAIGEIESAGVGKAQFTGEETLERAQSRSMRPLACGFWAAMRVIPSLLQSANEPSDLLFADEFSLPSDQRSWLQTKILLRSA